MDPATWSALIAGGAKAGSEIFSGFGAQKDSKRKQKEQKRKTIAEMLNAALERESKSGQESRRGQREMAGARAQAMQQLASQIIQSLR